MAGRGSITSPHSLRPAPERIDDVQAVRGSEGLLPSCRGIERQESRAEAGEFRFIHHRHGLAEHAGAEFHQCGERAQPPVA